MDNSSERFLMYLDLPAVVTYPTCRSLTKSCRSSAILCSYCAQIQFGCINLIGARIDFLFFESLVVNEAEMIQKDQTSLFHFYMIRDLSGRE